MLFLCIKWRISISSVYFDLQCFQFWDLGYLIPDSVPRNMRKTDVFVVKLDVQCLQRVDSLGENSCAEFIQGCPVGKVKDIVRVQNVNRFTIASYISVPSSIVGNLFNLHCSTSFRQPK